MGTTPLKRRIIAFKARYGTLWQLSFRHGGPGAHLGGGRHRLHDH